MTEPAHNDTNGSGFQERFGKADPSYGSLFKVVVTLAVVFVIGALGMGVLTRG